MVQLIIIAIVIGAFIAGRWSKGAEVKVEMEAKDSIIADLKWWKDNYNHMLEIWQKRCDSRYTEQDMENYHNWCMRKDIDYWNEQTRIKGSYLTVEDAVMLWKHETREEERQHTGTADIETKG